MRQPTKVDGRNMATLASSCDVSLAGAKQVLYEALALRSEDPLDYIESFGLALAEINTAHVHAISMNTICLQAANQTSPIHGQVSQIENTLTAAKRVLQRTIALRSIDFIDYIEAIGLALIELETTHLLIVEITTTCLRAAKRGSYKKKKKKE